MIAPQPDRSKTLLKTIWLPSLSADRSAQRKTLHG